MLGGGRWGRVHPLVATRWKSIIISNYIDLKVHGGLSKMSSKSHAVSEWLIGAPIGHLITLASANSSNRGGVLHITKIL